MIHERDLAFENNIIEHAEINYERRVIANEAGRRALAAHHTEGDEELVPLKTPNSCVPLFIISEIAPEEPTCYEARVFSACVHQWEAAARSVCVDRSVIQRAHTVSIMDPFVVCVRSGRGDTGGLPNKNTCCKQEAGLRGENEDCMFDSASFFPLPVNLM